MTLFVANARALSMLDNFVDAIDAGAGAGEVRIYDGSVPADADAALGGATLLATLVMSDPAFGNASDAAPGATATADPITSDTSADATGTASFFRIVDSNGASVCQGSVGTSGEQLNLNTTSIVTGATVSITSMTATHPES
jgi:hypothetical protein